jgi:hypothetical protein
VRVASLLTKDELQTFKADNSGISMSYALFKPSSGSDRGYCGGEESRAEWSRVLEAVCLGKSRR